jgi:hypothetical protein
MFRFEDKHVEDVSCVEEWDAAALCHHLLGLFDPEDEGSMFFRNVGKYRSATRRHIPEEWNFQQQRFAHLTSRTIDM